MYFVITYIIILFHFSFVTLWSIFNGCYSPLRQKGFSQVTFSLWCLYKFISTVLGVIFVLLFFFFLSLKHGLCLHFAEIKKCTLCESLVLSLHFPALTWTAMTCTFDLLMCHHSLTEHFSEIHRDCICLSLWVKQCWNGIGLSNVFAVQPECQIVIHAF